ISLFGFFCNSLVLLLIKSSPSMSNSFGILTFGQAIADCGQQAIFAFYVVPTHLLLVNKTLEPHVVRRMGHFVVIFYQVCGFSHPCTAVNRFIAVYMPHSFAQIFNRRNTIILTLSCWVLAVVPTTIFLLHPICNSYIIF
ncbi:hypothetical protein PFISCL1PPCAC_3489, partial [Pristionchus fissidentatus]